jgi:serine/threonine-protein kinase RsbW
VIQVSEARAFSAKPFTDLSAVAPDAPMGDAPSWHIPADPLSVRNGLQAMLAARPLRDLCEDDRGDAELVLAEVLNNIVEHAYRDAPGHMTVFLRREVCAVEAGLPAGVLQVCVTDRGLPMPGLAPPAGQLGATEDLPEGGFGWFLIRLLTGGLTYHRAGQENRLTFHLSLKQS